MQHTKSQLNAIYYAYRDRAERRRAAGEAFFGWLKPFTYLNAPHLLGLKNAILCGGAGEFVRTSDGYRESRHSINWPAVEARPFFITNYVNFERYRAAVRAQKSRYYRRRLAKLGIDWKTVKRPYGTEAIDLD